VGQWKVRGNEVLGDDTVTFYAIDLAEEPRLAACLRSFASRLPAGVTQAGRYLE
jgi:hypothetical protein